MNENDKTLQTLTKNERKLIQLRYEGLKTSKEIAEECNTTAGNVRNLFSNGGRLEKIYLEYSTNMNEVKEKTEIEEAEITIVEMTKGARYEFGQVLKEIKAGNIKPSIADVEKLWKMSRIMRNLPIDISKVEQSGKIDVATSKSVDKTLPIANDKLKEEIKNDGA